MEKRTHKVAKSPAILLKLTAVLYCSNRGNPGREPDSREAGLPGNLKPLCLAFPIGDLKLLFLAIELDSLCANNQCSGLYEVISCFCVVSDR